MKLPGNLRAINSILDFFYSRTIAGRRQAARGENIKRRSSGITTKSNSTTRIAQIHLEVVLPVVTVPSASDTPLVQREYETTSDQNTVAITEGVICASLLKENDGATQARTVVAVSADETWTISPKLRNVVNQILASMEREVGIAQTTRAVYFATASIKWR